MLSIYRRHHKDCPHAGDRISAKCRCVWWAKGTIEGKPYQKSLKTRDKERGEQIIRNLERGERPKEEPSKGVTVKDALAAFTRDCESEIRNLNPSTLRKYKLMASRLREYASGKGIVLLTEFTPEHAGDFRAGWKGSPRTLQKALERLRSAFRFFQEKGWITAIPVPRNPRSKLKQIPRLPFAEEEVRKILARAKDDRELAFLSVLRHTGLRIGDASLLTVSQLSENRIYLYTTKAGTPVSVVIPPHLVSLLKAIKPKGGYFFVRGDSTSMHTCADLWRRRFKIICEEAKIVPDHPHRMRHTLAADLLTKGASVEDVAAILGNSPAIVQRHYSQWIKSRQDRLDAFLEKTWTPALRAVK